MTHKNNNLLIEIISKNRSPLFFTTQTYLTILLSVNSDTPSRGVHVFFLSSSASERFRNYPVLKDRSSQNFD